MASEIIKKVTINKNELPPVTDSNGYYFRYRIVSEDKNRYSHWSEINYVENFPVTLVDGSVSINSDLTTATVVWGDEENRPKYDIFVKFDSGDFIYHGTSSTHSYSFLLDLLATSLEVKVQIEGVSKTIQEDLIIFETSGPISIYSS